MRDDEDDTHTHTHRCFHGERARKAILGAISYNLV